MLGDARAAAGADSAGELLPGLSLLAGVRIAAFRPKSVKESGTVSATKAIVSGLSGRYARALFDLAREAKLIDKIASDLALMQGLLDDGESDVRRAFASPRVARGDLGRAVELIAKHTGLDRLSANFLGVLAQNRRLAALAAIIRDFNALAADHKGEISADVRAAHPLSDAQMADLQKQLRAGVGRDVKVNLKIDEALLGGLVVKIGSRQIDSSIATKLNRLRIAMKGAG